MNTTTLVLLAACAGAVACTSDPEASPSGIGSATASTAAGPSGSGGAGAAGGATGVGGSGATGAGPTGAGGAAPTTVPGWAGVADQGVETTTGGGDLEPIEVSNEAELEAAIEGEGAAVIRVHGEIEGDFSVGSNKTIEGEPGATIRGGLVLWGSVNVIVRNLKVVGHNCADGTCGVAISDTIIVRGGAHHIWLDHLDISDGTDGNLDIIEGSDLITVSWTKFHYSDERVNMPADSTDEDLHRFASLIGNGGPNDALDQDHLRVTFDHVWWSDHVYHRQPQVRWGQVHVTNSLYDATDNGTCVGLGAYANVRLENNVFTGSCYPILPQEGSNPETTFLSIDNVFQGKPNTQGEGEAAFTPPYPYELATAEEVKTSVPQSAGPQP